MDTFEVFWIPAADSGGHGSFSCPLHVHGDGGLDDFPTLGPSIHRMELNP